MIVPCGMTNIFTANFCGIVRLPWIRLVCLHKYGHANTDTLAESLSDCR